MTEAAAQTSPVLLWEAAHCGYYEVREVHRARPGGTSAPSKSTLLNLIGSGKPFEGFKWGHGSNF